MRRAWRPAGRSRHAQALGGRVIFLDHGVGRLARNCSLPSLAVVVAISSATARSLATRRFSASTSTVPDVSRSTWTVEPDNRTSTRRCSGGRRRASRESGQCIQVVEVGSPEILRQADGKLGGDSLTRSQSPGRRGSGVPPVTSFCRSSCVWRPRRRGPRRWLRLRRATTTDLPPVSAPQRPSVMNGITGDSAMQQARVTAPVHAGSRGGEFVGQLHLWRAWRYQSQTRPTQSGRALRTP